MNTKPKDKKSVCKSPTAVPQAACTDGDAAALDRFCQDLPHDDMPLESWNQAFHDLDLQVPLWMTPDDALAGCLKTVHFCRCIRREGEAKPARQPASCEVLVPARAAEGQRLVVQGVGDLDGQQVGDLVVVFKIKAPVKG